MNSPDNVVSFPDASRRKLHSEADKIRHKLTSAARLDHAAIPLLATNLGRMAHRLDSESPKNGAKRMFKAAFPGNWESVWRKRHRLVRLPGEPAPAFDASGQYEAAGAKYLHLADAFASLKSPDDQSARDAAVNALTRGTAYNTGPAIVGTQDEMARIFGALRRVAHKLSQSGEVSRAFQILRKHPIARSDAGIEIKSGAEAAIEKFYLLYPNDGWEGETHWALPYTEIGRIHLPIVVPFIRLGPIAKFDAAIAPETWAEAKQWQLAYGEPDEAIYEADREISLAASDEQILRRARGLHGMIALRKRLAELELPEDAFTLDLSDPDYRAANDAALALPHHLRGTIYARSNVGICAWPTDREGGIDVRVVGGADEFGHGTDLILSSGDLEENIEGHSEVQTVNRAATFVNMRGHVVAVPSFEMILGIIPNSLDGLHDLDSDAAQQILMHGGANSGPFQPTVWDDSSRLVPAPHLSVAATILRNLAFGKGLDRIDERLLADAERRLEPVLKFYEEQLLAFEEAADF